MTINTSFSANNLFLSAAATEPQMDGTQSMGDLMNNFWQYFSKVKAGSSTDAEVKALMATVKELSAFFTANGNPSKKLNPKTYAVYLAVNIIPIDGIKTLAAYSTSGTAEDIAALEDSDNTDFSSLTAAVNGWYNGNVPRPQSGDADVEYDFEVLNQALKTYNKGSNKDVYAKAIADSITKLVTDMGNLPGGKISDGYLRSAYDFIVGNGLDTAVATYEAAYAKDPATKPTALEALLDSTSGVKGNQITLAKDFANFVQAAGVQEYNDW